jgi:hypothetical protein
LPAEKRVSPKALYKAEAVLTPFASVVTEELPMWSPSRKERVVPVRTARRVAPAK